MYVSLSVPPSPSIPVPTGKPWQGFCGMDGAATPAADISALGPAAAGLTPFQTPSPPAAEEKGMTRWPPPLPPIPAPPLPFTGLDSPLLPPQLLAEEESLSRSSLVEVGGGVVDIVASVAPAIRARTVCPGGGGDDPFAADGDAD